MNYQTQVLLAVLSVVGLFALTTAAAFVFAWAYDRKGAQNA